MEAELQRLKDELKSIKSANKSLTSTNLSLKSKLESLKSKLSSTKTSHRHPTSFWNNIKIKLRDTEYIKGLIKDGTVTVNDFDEDERSLLHYAAWKGNYEIAQLCINLGADIHKKSRFSQDETRLPLDWAMENNNDHIEQLLLLQQTKSNVGDRVKYISHGILKQNSIIENIINELSLIGEQSKDIFTRILKEITINLISKKLVFSEDLLNLCWKLETENGDELESELWSSIKKTCKDIINGTSKRDWFWLKQCLLPSNV